MKAYTPKTPEPENFDIPVSHIVNDRKHGVSGPKVDLLPVKEMKEAWNNLFHAGMDTVQSLVCEKSVAWHPYGPNGIICLAPVKIHEAVRDWLESNHGYNLIVVQYRDHARNHPALRGYDSVAWLTRLCPTAIGEPAPHLWAVKGAPKRKKQGAKWSNQGTRRNRTLSAVPETLAQEVKLFADKNGISIRQLQIKALCAAMGKDPDMFM